MKNKNKILAIFVACVMAICAIVSPAIFVSGNATTANAASVPTSTIYYLKVNSYVGYDGSDSGVYIHTAIPTNESTFYSTRDTTIPSGSVLRYLNEVSGGSCYSVNGNSKWYVFQCTGVNGSSSVRYISAACATKKTAYFGGFYKLTSANCYRDSAYTSVCAQGQSGWFPMYRDTSSGTKYVLMSQTQGSAGTGVLGYVKSADADSAVIAKKTIDTTCDYLRITSSNGATARCYPSSWTGANTTLQPYSNTGTYYSVLAIYSNSYDGYNWYQIQTGSYTSWVRADACTVY